MKIRLNDSTDATEIVSIANRFKNCDIDIKSETQFREMIIKSQESDKKETEEETETE